MKCWQEEYVSCQHWRLLVDGLLGKVAKIKPYPRQANTKKRLEWVNGKKTDKSTVSLVCWTFGRCSVRLRHQAETMWWNPFRSYSLTAFMMMGCKSLIVPSDERQLWKTFKKKKKNPNILFQIYLFMFYHLSVKLFFKLSFYVCLHGKQALSVSKFETQTKMCAMVITLTLGFVSVCVIICVCVWGGQRTLEDHVEMQTIGRLHYGLWILWLQSTRNIINNNSSSSTLNGNLAPNIWPNYLLGSLGLFISARSSWCVSAQTFVFCYLRLCLKRTLKHINGTKVDD